jgi:SAM-dependent methyltransferase
MGFTPKIVESPDAALPLLFAQTPEISDFTRMRRALARGDRVTDRDFDRIFPDEIQSLSRIHWTPVEVARRAAELLVDTPGTRILDVGAGVGKFCFVAALTSAAEVVGVEQRPDFVKLARWLGGRYRIPRVSFTLGNAVETDWQEFSAIYLFNPYCEALHASRQIDLTVPAGVPVYQDYLRKTEAQLSRTRIGTRVLLYHGFGGEMPKSFHLETSEWQGSGSLELWLKTS